jgi:hypothetical protein
MLLASPIANTPCTIIRNFKKPSSTRVLFSRKQPDEHFVEAGRVVCGMIRRRL